MGHLMAQSSPIPVKTMHAIAVPGGYVSSLAALPDMPHPPQSTVSPEHDVALDDDDNDPQGDDNFGGFNFGDAEQPPSYHPHRTPPTVPRYDAAGPSHFLMLPTPPTYEAGPSHQPDHSVPPMTTYHIPPILFTYLAIQDGMPITREIP